MSDPLSAYWVIVGVTVAWAVLCRLAAARLMRGTQDASEAVFYVWALHYAGIFAGSVAGLVLVARYWLA